MLTRTQVDDLRMDAEEALSGSNLRGAVLTNLDALIDDHLSLLRRFEATRKRLYALEHPREPGSFEWVLVRP